MSLGVFPIGIDPAHVAETLKVPWVQVSLAVVFIGTNTMSLKLFTMNAHHHHERT